MNRQLDLRGSAEVPLRGQCFTRSRDRVEGVDRLAKKRASSSGVRLRVKLEPAVRDCSSQLSLSVIDSG